ncbi:MAG: polysaccharide biosynthesis/export family protein [Chakrabartia sp.]
MRSFAALLLVATSLAAATVSTAAFGQSEAAPVVTDKLPAPSFADLEGSDRPYHVGPFDRLTIDVFGSDALSNKEVQVDASGRFGFPLIGTLEVGGKTPEEIAALIADQLRGRYIRNPQVSVNLKEVVSQRVTIGGEVKKPGVYPVLGRMTLLTAIATAEGWTDFSNKGNVVIFRIADGKKYAAVYNVKAIERGRYDDPEIFATDVVMVGDSQGRKIWKDFLSSAPLLAPVIYLLGRN